MTNRLHVLIVALFVMPCLFSNNAFSDQGFLAGKSGFRISLNGWVNEYNVWTVTVLPAEKLILALDDRDHRTTDFHLKFPNDLFITEDEGSWNGRAPSQVGWYPIEILNRGTGQVMQINLLVMLPLASLSQDGSIKSFQVGHYPLKPLRGLPAYRPPEGLVQVTADLIELPVSPHFQLGQFLCKQEGDFPKYLVLQPALLLKLERLLEALNKKGIYAPTFTIMSGYRTPSYNLAIGQGVYSRHQWGDAADIFVDVSPVDGRMDDLNADGFSDQHDAAFLYQFVERYRFEPIPVNMLGGLGDYGPNQAHGPFVHIDTRGYRARWGISGAN